MIKNLLLTRRAFTISELLMVFLILIIIGALMLPVIHFSRQSMEETMCGNNLRQIGLAVYIYAREHDGKFPPTLKTLYDEHYLADKRLMDCPASKSIGTVDAPDYVYAGGLSVRDASLTPLVRDKSENHPRGGTNVLHVNGGVVWKQKETKAQAN